MNDSNEGRSGVMKKVAIGAGGALAIGAGGAGAARLLRKQKLAGRIGTPLSKSKIVGHMPGKTRQATGRVVELSARLDAVLRDFTEISTEEQPYSYGGYDGPSIKKPRFASLHLSRATDKGLMKLPGEGRAVISYKVKSRRVDEDTEDGVPLYGGDIEVRSIEPIGEDGGTDLSETLYLRELAGGYVNTEDGVKRERGKGAHFNRHAGKYVGGLFAVPSMGLSLATGALVDRHRKKKNVAATGSHEKHRPWASKGEGIGKRLPKDAEKAKDLSETLYLRHLSGARDRDPAGRFSAGGVPAVDDYHAAAALRKKKVIGGVAAGLGAAALGGTAQGRALGGGLVRGALRGMR
jgi:hypothetical protein